MAEYKPSFVFQSKINDKLNTSTTASAQADGDNIIGSVNPSDVSSVISPNSKLTFQYTASNLAASQPTASTVYTDPAYIKSIINTASRFLCEEIPSSGCDDPKSLVTSPTSKTLVCACPSEESFDPPTDDNLNAIMNSVDSVMRTDRENSLKECFDVNSLADLSNSLGSSDDFAKGVINTVTNRLDQILDDQTLSMDQKYTGAINLLDLFETVIFLNGLTVNEDTNSIVTQMKDIITGCTDEVKNDCVLNRAPSANSIIAVMNFTNTKAKECSGDLVLNEECECVCPSGTEPCGADTCIGCDAGLIVQKTTDFLNDTVNCECVCPSGTVQYNLPTNMGDRPDGVSKTSCIPECPKGYIFKEIEASISEFVNADKCDFIIDGRCYACVCPKRANMFGFGSTTLVEDSDCVGGSSPDPDNECECKCDDENKTYIDAEEAVIQGLGSAACYCGTELQLPDYRLRKAYCNKIKLGYDIDGEVDYTPLQTIRAPREWDHETCSCICPSGMASVGETCDCLNTLHIWSNYFSGCVCGAQAQMEAGWDPAEECGTAESGKVWDYENCECVCPSGTNYDAAIEECVCPEGSTPTTPGKPTGGQDCACPEGQIINQNEEGNYYCASGSYTYTNLTMSELSRIASSFGYSFNNTMELL